MTSIKAYVQSVIFYNESNNYAVVRVKLDQKKDERIVCVGYFPIPNKEELCLFTGEYVDHPSFGRQFKVESLEKILPDGAEAIIRYLSSSLFAGVGVKTAEKVYAALGDDCLNIIKDNPERIKEVNIKEELQSTIVRGIAASTRLDEAIKLFVGHGIQMKYLIKMDALYGKNLIPIVLENPYILIKDIDGLNFKTVDRVAKSLGITECDSRRLDALLIYISKKLCYQSQDTYISQNDLYRFASLEVGHLTEEDFLSSFHHLLLEGELIDEEGRIYYADLYQAEKGIAKYLKPYILKREGKLPETLIDQEISSIELQENIEYSWEQKEAIKKCLNNGLSIITGGPGTGKTTVVNAIIKVYQTLFKDESVVLCAPTGRAAKRLSELSNQEATTIHRLLKWDLDTNKFAKNFDDPLFGGLLIIDEFSMVDCQLFYHLLDATYPFKKILLIGDDKQLPPVSPGDVLRDLLELQRIPTTELVQIHRQKEDSGIIPLCYDIRKGSLNKENLKKSDVHFYSCESRKVREMILTLVKEAVSEGLNQADIQVLAPMYAGTGGIDSLNDLLRDYFNPESSDKKEVAIGRTTYRIGDKILQLKNQPDDNVYNGDIGWLEEIIEDGRTLKLLINFDDNLVQYVSGDFMNITHAYCISVHKSQGSEYSYVIMPILPEHRIMLKRKLIYTGVSRAKKRLSLIGDLLTFERGLKRVEQNVRKTSLKERMLEYLEG